jgi:tetratricopeptide (TPR) repeat protein
MIQSLPELVAGRPVRWLGIGDGPIDDSHVEGLCAALPRIDGIGVLTTKPRALLSALRRFKDVELATRKMDSRVLVRKLPGALSPDLERLVLHGMNDEIEAGAFDSILSREVFPKLRDFGVFGPHAMTFELLKALIASKLWPNLESFGMCAAEMWDDDDTEGWLGEHGDHFAHLDLFTSAIWPDDDNAHESGRLGLILKAIDRAAEAVPEIEHHLQFSGDDPQHYGCWEELGEAMVWAGWPDEALVPLDRGLEKFKHECDYDSIYTYRTKAEALDALGRFEESLAMCEKTLESDDDNSWTHRYMGRALRELKRYPEALIAFDKAIMHAADEDEDDRPDVLGWAYVELGRTRWQMRRARFARSRTHAKGVTRQPSRRRGGPRERSRRNAAGSPKRARRWRRPPRPSRRATSSHPSTSSARSSSCSATTRVRWRPGARAPRCSTRGSRPRIRPTRCSRSAARPRRWPRPRAHGARAAAPARSRCTRSAAPERRSSPSRISATARVFPSRCARIAISPAR